MADPRLAEVCWGANREPAPLFIMCQHCNVEPTWDGKPGFCSKTCRQAFNAGDRGTQVPSPAKAPAVAPVQSAAKQLIAPQHRAAQLGCLVQVGYIDGNCADIETKQMTPQEAEEYGRTLPNCAGFCYRGTPDLTEITWIWFKGEWTFHGGDHGWTSVKYVQEAAAGDEAVPRHMAWNAETETANFTDVKGFLSVQEANKGIHHVSIPNGTPLVAVGPMPSSDNEFWTVRIQDLSRVEFAGCDQKGEEQAEEQVRQNDGKVSVKRKHVKDSVAPLLDGAVSGRSSTQSWMHRVTAAQAQHLSPEQRAEALARAERQRHTEMARRKTQAVKAHAARTRALCAEGLRQTGAAPSADIEATRTRWIAATGVSAARQERALCMLNEQPAPSARAVALRDAFDEEAEALEEVTALVGGDAWRITADAEATAGPGSGTDAVATVLEQLRTEPADEAQRAAKFMLYEEYAAQVEKLRETVFKLFEESRSGLPAAVAADMDRQLKGIDRKETMGIPEATREWFVFHMMKAAEANNRRMAAILDGFERKLGFFAKSDQGGCPVCFEEFDEASPTKAPQTLGCCHRVCKECWTNWSTVMRGQPFCPLCRHGEFLGTIMAS